MAAGTLVQTIPCVPSTAERVAKGWPAIRSACACNENGNAASASQLNESVRLRNAEGVCGQRIEGKQRVIRKPIAAQMFKKRNFVAQTQLLDLSSSSMNRREFFRCSAAVAAGATILHSFPYHLFAAGAPKAASDSVTLGSTGITTSRLAMGTGTGGVGGSSIQTRGLGVDGLAGLLKLGYDHGVTFWDTADQYGSHPHLAAALKGGVPREHVTILTKTEATTASQMRADLDRFRREIGTDYLDIVLLHCLTDADWPKLRAGAMEVLSEAREQGIIRAHGVSCHTFGALKTAAATDWVQVDLARVNPAQVLMDSNPAAVTGVLREMKAKGKGIIGMKILGAGQLAFRADECFQWALAQDCLDGFTLGMQDAGEFQRTIKQIPAASVRA